MSTSTPPPLPPKSPSLAPSVRTMRSTTTYSSYTTEHPISPGRPTHAQRGTRTTASSIHLTHPDQLLGLGGDMKDQSPRQGGVDESLDYDHESSQDVSAQDIANLPWAQPHPRDPSPLPSSLQRPPSFSFLASDPAQPAFPEHDTMSRRSSRSSISSRRSHNVPQPWSATGPATYLVPSVDHSHDPHQHRLSSQTVHSYQSGMADMGTVEEMGIPPFRQGPSSQDESHTSAMAVRASSSMSNRSLKSTLQLKIRSLKSKNSSKSTTSSKKRISNSTIHRRSFQRKYGKWEVEMSPLLEKENLRRMEETLELAELLGRATVLERMLKAGQRVSGPNPLIPSLRRFASKSTKPSSRPSTSDTSAPSQSIRSPSIRSFRRQFSRRVKREDEFTEIDSQSGFGSTRPEIVVVSQTQMNPEKEIRQEEEKNWVVLIPEPGPPTPTKGKDDGTTTRIPTCMTFHPCSNEKPPLTPSIDHSEGEEEQERTAEPFRQSPHLGHRSPDHHHRQSVLTYLSAGKWSSSTRGGRRRRKIVLGISIGCVIGVILLTGLLAGLLAKRM